MFHQTLDGLSECLNAFVRPLLAIMFGGAIVYMAMTGMVTSGEFLGIAAMAIGFYFQARQAEKAEARLDKKHDELVDLAKATPPVVVEPQRIVHG